MMTRHELKRNHTKLLRECMKTFAELLQWSFVEDSDVRNGFVALAHADKWVKRNDWDLGAEMWKIVSQNLSACVSSAMKVDSRDSRDLWRLNENFMAFTELLLRIQKHVRQVTQIIAKEHPNAAKLPWAEANALMGVAV